MLFASETYQTDNEPHLMLSLIVNKQPEAESLGNSSRALNCLHILVNRANRISYCLMFHEGILWMTSKILLYEINKMIV